MLALRDSLAQIPELRRQCTDSSSSTLQQIAQLMDECTDLTDAISTAIVDDPPVSVKDGGLIREGYHAHLDELREASVPVHGMIIDPATGQLELLVNGYDQVEVPSNS